ncbi:MAG TPA: Dabb family protein [Vicinamibacterales bacterium]|nr:Dabb family protein [Vicinamibacterales bacterium]
MVSFKYKADTSDAARADHRARLGGLKDLDGILDFKVGADFVRSPRSFDTGIVVLFRDRASLDAYAVNPRHVPVAQLGRDLSETIVAVDFDA